MDARFLLHSEQKRRLGPVSLFAFAFALCMPLTVFVVIPYSLVSGAGPSTLVGVMIAVVLLLLAVLHTAELSAAVPRAWCTIHVTLHSHGSLAAVALGFLELVDSLTLAALLAKATSAHTNALFRGLLRNALEVEVSPVPECIKWLLDARFDFTVFIGLVGCFLLLSGSLKVVGTVAFCLLVVSSLVVASCSLVAFFHADPANWVHAPFFSGGADGVLFSACALLAGLRVPSTLVALLDDAWQPRTRAPSVLPAAAISAALFSFFVSLTFSLCVNVTRVPELLLLPDVFQTLNVPAAKYMLTVSSVCGLWGALIASLLPGSRLLLSLSGAQLLPAISGRLLNESPRRAQCALLCSLLPLLLVRSEHLICSLAFTTPLSLLVTVCLSIGQHYSSRAVGMSRETSRYRRVKQPTLTGWTRKTDSTSSGLSSAHSSAIDEESDESEESTERLPLRLLPFSPSGYNAMLRYHRKHPHAGHNCLAQPCAGAPTGMGANGTLHLYADEQPELPYYGAFAEGTQARSPSMDSVRVPEEGARDDETEEGESGVTAAVLLSVHLALSALFAVIARRVFPLPLVLHLSLLSLLSLGFIPLVFAFTRLRPSTASLRWQQRVPVFPLFSLAASFGLVVCLSATRLASLVLVLPAVVGGCTVHILSVAWGLSRGSSPNLTPLVIVNRGAIGVEDERAARAPFVTPSPSS